MTAGKWGYTMAVAIRNQNLHRGEFWLALDVAGVWAILTALCVGAILMGESERTIQSEEWWVALVLVGIPAVLCGILFAKAPRQLVRFSDSTLQVGSFRWRKHRRLRVRWSDMEECLLSERCVGIAACGQRIELRKQLFAKKDWGLLRAELEAHLTPYFDFDAPTRYDLRRQRQRAWSIWRKVLDKIALVGAVVGLSGPLFLGVAVASYFGLTESIAGGVIVCASATPSIVVLVAVLRYAQRQKYERWHERRVEPVG